MDKNRAIWWLVGGVATIGIAYVTYLFVIAPLPARFQKDFTAEAKVQLQRGCRMQKDYFEAHGHFAPHMDSLGYYQAETDGGQYWLEVDRQDSMGFALRAYAREDWDNDEMQSVWEVGMDCEPKELQAD
jgi:hypothetical protein